MVQRHVPQRGLCRNKEKCLKPSLKCVNRWSSSTCEFSETRQSLGQQRWRAATLTLQTINRQRLDLLQTPTVRQTRPPTTTMKRPIKSTNHRETLPTWRRHCRRTVAGAGRSWPHRSALTSSSTESATRSASSCRNFFITSRPARERLLLSDPCFLDAIYSSVKLLS